MYNHIFVVVRVTDCYTHLVLFWCVTMLIVLGSCTVGLSFESLNVALVSYRNLNG